WVRGVDRADRIRPQHGPGAVVGVLTDREGEVPVHSLARLLGRRRESSHQPEGAEAHILFLNGDPGPLALLVDRTSPVQRVGAGSFLALPALVAAHSARY